MSLSEHERKVLEQLERDLYEGDAQFAKRMGADKQKLAQGQAASSKRIIAGGAVALAGLGVLIQSLILRYPIFGVVGFALMVVGLWLATAQFGRLNRIANQAAKDSSAAKASSTGDAAKTSFTDFFERRWDQRDQ